jgi:hypothetical protein
MRLQKAKKLTKNSSLLPQTPNRKQALIKTLPVVAKKNFKER